jgi:hypothetical protein
MAARNRRVIGRVGKGYLREIETDVTEVIQKWTLMD